MASPTDQAENVGGVVSAARLRESFLQRRAKTSNQERRGALGDAIGTLEVRFPELEEVPPGGAERFARERGHGSKSRSPSQNGRRSKQATERAAAGGGGGSSSRAGGSTKRPRGRRSDSPRLRRAARRGLRDTGIPGATVRTTSLVLSIFGLTVGVSLLYLLLTNAQTTGPGQSAVGRIANGLATAVESLILPIDPFTSAGEARAAARGESAVDLYRRENPGAQGPHGPVGVDDTPSLPEFSPSQGAVDRWRRENPSPFDFEPIPLPDFRPNPRLKGAR